MVTVLLLRFAPFEDGTAIKLTTSCPPPFKSTNDTPPFPPGVTMPQLSRGSTATCGFDPVRLIWLVAESASLPRPMPLAWVGFRYTTRGFPVRELTPTAYGSRPRNDPLPHP